MGWFRPTSTDAGNDWANPGNAWDNDQTTNANESEAAAPNRTSNLDLGFATKNCKTVKVLNCAGCVGTCMGGPTGCKIDIDVWNTDTSAWDDVYDGAMSDGGTGMCGVEDRGWVEQAFAAKNISKVRIACYHTAAAFYHIFDVQLEEIPPVPRYPAVNFQDPAIV